MGILIMVKSKDLTIVKNNKRCRKSWEKNLR